MSSTEAIISIISMLALIWLLIRGPSPSQSGHFTALQDQVKDLKAALDESRHLLESYRSLLEEICTDKVKSAESDETFVRYGTYFFKDPTHPDGVYEPSNSTPNIPELEDRINRMRAVLQGNIDNATAVLEKDDEIQDGEK